MCAATAYRFRVRDHMCNIRCIRVLLWRFALSRLCWGLKWKSRAAGNLENDLRLSTLSRLVKFAVDLGCSE